jgi:S-adenosylmethionine hydrolase
VELKLPEPRLGTNLLEGEILFVDDFGNLLSNIPGEALEKCEGRVKEVLVGDHPIRQKARTYADAAAGELIVLVSSSGNVEIAEVQGNAAIRLGASVGTPIRVQL